MSPWPARAAPALCLAALGFAAGPARAETPPAPDPAHDAAAPPTPAAAARLEEAKRHMKAGAAFYKDPSGHKCEEALREFRRAFELSGSLNAVKGMAVCDLELERDGESIDLYAAYLRGKRDTIDPAERAQVEGDLATLRASVARVSLSANRDGVRITDVRTPAKGYPIRNTYPMAVAGARLGIHPGQHVFTASAEGAPDQVWKVEIANGGSYTHAFAFPGAQPVADASGPTVRPVPPSVYATLGLTAALAVPWGILAARAKIKNDDYERVNGKETAAQLADLRSDVKSANLLADIFLGATLASLTATMVLFFTRPSVPARAGAAGRPRLTLAVLAPDPRSGQGTLGALPPNPRSGLLAVGVSSRGAVATGWF